MMVVPAKIVASHRGGGSLSHGVKWSPPHPSTRRDACRTSHLSPAGARPPVGPLRGLSGSRSQPQRLQGCPAVRLPWTGGYAGGKKEAEGEKVCEERKGEREGGGAEITFSSRFTLKCQLCSPELP